MTSHHGFSPNATPSSASSGGAAWPRSGWRATSGTTDRSRSRSSTRSWPARSAWTGSSARCGSPRGSSTPTSCRSSTPASCVQADGLAAPLVRDGLPRGRIAPHPARAGAAAPDRRGAAHHRRRWRTPSQAAHRQGIVHRDIKPDNILLSGGRVYVIDFGIAKALMETGGERLTSTGLAIGTPAYMSPEQASAGRVDARSDQYSLATVLVRDADGRASVQRPDRPGHPGPATRRAGPPDPHGAADRAGGNRRRRSSGRSSGCPPTATPT